MIGKSLLVATVAVLGLAACGGSDDKPSTATEVVEQLVKDRPTEATVACRNINAQPAIGLGQVLAVLGTEGQAMADKYHVDADDLARALVAYCVSVA